MRTTLQLRRWQHDALEALRQNSGADFLAVATPGAGKMAVPDIEYGYADARADGASCDPRLSRG